MWSVIQVFTWVGQILGSKQTWVSKLCLSKQIGKICDRVGGELIIDCKPKKVRKAELSCASVMSMFKVFQIFPPTLSSSKCSSVMK